MRQLIQLGVAVATMCGCHTTIVEAAGSSRYLFVNQTSRALEVQFSAAPGSPVGEGVVDCPAKAECLLATDGSIGVNPNPTDSFASVSAVVSMSGTKTRVFHQQPPVNARWTVNGQPAGFVPCCSERDIQLIVTDADLNLP